MKRRTLLYLLMTVLLTVSFVFAGCDMFGGDSGDTGDTGDTGDAGDSGDSGDTGDSGGTDSYEEARLLMNGMLAGDPDVDVNEIYNLLVSAVADDPDHTDAILSLAFFDIMSFLVHEDVSNIMTDGFGYTEYPENVQELYETMLETNEMFNPSDPPSRGFWTEGGGAVFPVLANFSAEEGFNPQDYLLQVADNLGSSVYSLDDVADGILGALGDSFDRTIANINGLSSNGLFAVTADSVPPDAEDDVFSDIQDELPLYFTAAEAKLMAAPLYMVRAFANMIMAVNYSLDISVVIDGLDLDTGSFELAESPFLDSFLQADSDWAAYMEAARDDIIAANRMTEAALAAISARTAADEDLVFSPVSPLFTNAEGGPTWESVVDAASFLQILLNKEYASIDAGGGTLVVVPNDAMDFDSMEAFIAHYADEANWPEAADVQITESEVGGETVYSLEPAAVAHDPGLFLSSEFGLLNLILEVDADGEPTVYVDSSGDTSGTMAVAGASYDSAEAYYLKVPDVTFNGLISADNNPKVSVAELQTYVNELLAEAMNTDLSSLPALPLVMKEVGSSIEVYVWEMMLYRGYPIMFHTLEPKGTTETIDGNDYTSAGSFWLGLAEFAENMLSETE